MAVDGVREVAADPLVNTHIYMYIERDAVMIWRDYATESVPDTTRSTHHVCTEDVELFFTPQSSLAGPSLVPMALATGACL